jgi:hypothetical protein
VYSRLCFTVQCAVDGSGVGHGKVDWCGVGQAEQQCTLVKQPRVYKVDCLDCKVINLNLYVYYCVLQCVELSCGN